MIMGRSTIALSTLSVLFASWDRTFDLPYTPPGSSFTMNTSNRLADRLSVLVTLLMGGAAAAGLGFHDLYRDNSLVTASWWGNDLVTLVVATPLLVGAMIGARRGSWRARLVWMGMLAYGLYNAAFYLFGAAFNSLFLVYVATVTLAGFALIFGLVSLDADAIADQALRRRPARWVAGFVVLVAVALGAFHSALWLHYVVTGTVPAVLDAVGLHTHLIGALDLSMVVSVGLLAGVWLWQGRPWGYVWAVIWTVKGAVYMLALSAATATSVLLGPADGWAQLFLWGPIGVGCLVASLAGFCA
jgi:hypothetical protein